MNLYITKIRDNNEGGGGGGGETKYYIVHFYFGFIYKWMEQ